MANPDYADFFRRYADAYQRSLGDHVEADVIRSFFAESFLAMSLDGSAVQPGTNDDSFTTTLEQGYGFYKSIGTIGMRSDGVAVEPIADNHDRVTVRYVARYRRQSGEEFDIAFSLVYLLQRRLDGPKIFAFIAGDELALYREHGLVDDQGKPLAS